MRKQQFIVSNSQQGFSREVNKLLAQGWRMVPGTIYTNSVRQTPTRDTPPEHIDQMGHHHRLIFSVVLEMPEGAEAPGA